MKMISNSLFVLLFVAVLQSYAIEGGGGYDQGNGGDICENRFKTVRDDLSAWIINGGSADLLLPAEIPHDKYRQVMLEKTQTAKVSCIDEQVFVGKAEKTCKNFVEADGSLRIQCNRERFMTTSESDQYVLVHHEYAGLAGFEVNTGEDSNYQISEQITGYLENQIVQKLVVKHAQNTSQDPFDPASCLDSQMSLEDAHKLVPPENENKIFAEFRIHARSRMCNQLNNCEAWETAENEVKLYDRDRDHNGTYVILPNHGQMSFVSSGETLGVQFLTFSGNSLGRGIFMDCGRLQRFDGTCSLSTLPRTGMEYVGETFGVIGAHCTRLTHTQKRFINSSSMWLEQELVFLSRY